MNAISSAYGNKKNLGKPVGRFECKCGFVYIRKGPDQTKTDHHKWVSVQTYGPVWEEALKRMWEDTSMTLREVATQLGVDPLTVKRRAIYLGLTFPRETSGSMRASGEVLDRYRIVRKRTQDEREERRLEWLSVRKSNPGAGRLEFQAIAPSLIEWLRKHDPQWLEENMPATRNTAPTPVRVNWAEKDVELAQAVKEAAAHVRDTANPPVRVSISAIIKAVGRRAWLERDLDKLPLTKKLLDETLESREDFLIRKVKWAADAYRHEGACPTRSEFVVRAGVHCRSSGKSELVQRVVETALLSLAADGASCSS